MQKKKASDSIISDIVLQLSFLLDSGKIYRKMGRADCRNDFQTRSRACLHEAALHEASLLCLWMGNGCFLYAQHNFCSKNTVFISEAAVSSVFFCNVADRLDSNSVSGTLG